MSEKELYKKLLVDKSKKVETLVDKAKDVLGIDKETGEPIILVSRAKLRDEDCVALYLIGKFVASELELVNSPSATYNEIAENMGIDKAIVAARLSDMKRKGYVRSSSKGQWEIIFPRIGDILDEIRQRLGM
jgi:hypothetical protein